MRERTRIDRAVVVGGSVAGLATALGLAEQVAEVVVIERAETGADPAYAGTIAPQGPLPHVLLAGGSAALERLAPGFARGLFDAGASGDLTGPRPCHWWAFGAVRDHVPDLGVEVPMASRALVETHLRQRTLAHPRVTTRAATVDGIAVSDGRVVGVRAGGALVEGDLVVDATGRSARGAAWLEGAGVRVPAREQVAVDVVYTAVDVEREADDLDGGLFAVVQNTRRLARIGVALPAEGDRWQIVAGGYFRAAPALDPDSVRAFADGLPDPAVARLLRRPWLGSARRHRFPASERTRWDRAALPAGYCAVGDAVACFNPIYGQGMSSAALQAESLAGLVAAGHDVAEVTRQHARLAQGVAEAPWRVATGADFMYADTRGARPPGTHAVNRYLERVMAVSATDERVNLALSRVQQLLAPPASLMHPRVVARVLGRRRRTDSPRTVLGGDLATVPQPRTVADSPRSVRPVPGGDLATLSPTRTVAHSPPDGSERHQGADRPGSSLISRSSSPRAASAAAKRGPGSASQSVT